MSMCSLCTWRKAISPLLACWRSWAGPTTSKCALSRASSTQANLLGAQKMPLYMFTVLQVVREMENDRFSYSGTEI